MFSKKKKIRIILWRRRKNIYLKFVKHSLLGLYEPKRSGRIGAAHSVHSSVKQRGGGSGGGGEDNSLHPPPASFSLALYTLPPSPHTPERCNNFGLNFNWALSPRHLSFSLPLSLCLSHSRSVFRLPADWCTCTVHTIYIYTYNCRYIYAQTRLVVPFYIIHSYRRGVYVCVYTYGVPTRRFSAARVILSFVWTRRLSGRNYDNNIVVYACRRRVTFLIGVFVVRYTSLINREMRFPFINRFYRIQRSHACEIHSREMAERRFCRYKTHMHAYICVYKNFVSRCLWSHSSETARPIFIHFFLYI